MVLEQANVDVREQMKNKGITQWELAFLIGISKYTLNSWLQIPLTDERRQKIQKALDKINK